MQIKDVMCKDVVCVDPDSSVREAARKMRDCNVGTVAVVEGGRLQGLLNDRQITIGVIAAGKDPGKVRARDVMTKRLVTSTPEMDILDAAKIMGKLHYRRLPVVDREHHLRGIVSISDLSKPLKQYADNILDELAPREPSRPSRIEEPFSVPAWMF